MQPHDTHIAAALEEFVTDTQNTLDAALRQRPRDEDTKEEIKFWRRQRNAFVNAQGDWNSGRRLIPTDSGYLAPSASNPGSFHRCWRIGGVWACSCSAGEAGDFHRHTALIAAYERGAELAELSTQHDEDLETQNLASLDLDDRAAAADLVADAAAERVAIEMDEIEARRQLAERLCAARSRIAA